MSNPWIKHVEKVAKDQNISYGDALKVAKFTYKKKQKGGGDVIKGKASKVRDMIRRKDDLQSDELLRAVEHNIIQMEDGDYYTTLTRNKFSNAPTVQGKLMERYNWDNNYDLMQDVIEKSANKKVKYNIDMDEDEIKRNIENKISIMENMREKQLEKKRIEYEKKRNIENKKSVFEKMRKEYEKRQNNTRY